MKFILGKKIGMSQIFQDDRAIPVTLVEAGPCCVTQIKTEEDDGYKAVQVGFGETKKLKKPQVGHLRKIGRNLKYLVEFRISEPGEYKVGDQIDVSKFEVGDKVDVSGISKGRGFSGVIKRWGFSRGPMSHGSRHHRKPGSIGSMFPQRVVPGRKLPGRYGTRRVTLKNLKVMEVLKDKNVLVLAGAVPGPVGSLLEIKESKKPG